MARDNVEPIDVGRRLDLLFAQLQATVYNNSVRIQGKSFEPRPVEDFYIDWWSHFQKPDEPEEVTPPTLRKKAATAFAAFGGMDKANGS